MLAESQYDESRVTTAEARKTVLVRVSRVHLSQQPVRVLTCARALHRLLPVQGVPGIQD